MNEEQLNIQLLLIKGKAFEMLLQSTAERDAARQTVKQYEQLLGEFASVLGSEETDPQSIMNKIRGLVFKSIKEDV